MLFMLIKLLAFVFLPAAAFVCVLISARIAWIAYRYRAAERRAALREQEEELLAQRRHKILQELLSTRPSCLTNDELDVIADFVEASTEVAPPVPVPIQNPRPSVPVFLQLLPSRRDTIPALPPPPARFPAYTPVPATRPPAAQTPDHWSVQHAAVTDKTLDVIIRDCVEISVVEEMPTDPSRVLHNRTRITQNIVRRNTIPPLQPRPQQPSDFELEDTPIRDFEDDPTRQSRRLQLP